jgi:hypothetical protein
MYCREYELQNERIKTKEHLKIAAPRGALFRRARVRRRRRRDH